MGAPGFYATRLEDVAILRRPDAVKIGRNATLTSGMTCSRMSPTYRLPPGSVVVKKTSTGKFVHSTDPSGDRNSGAVVTSAEVPDGDWASKTITLTIDGRPIVTVTLGGSDDTTSEVVTALNANPTFAAYATASGADGAVLTVTSKATGAGVNMKLTSNLLTAFGSAGKDAAGVDADYRVTREFADMKDRDGNAIEPSTMTYLAGCFNANEFAVDGNGDSTLTGEAEAVLARRGSTFE